MYAKYFKRIIDFCLSLLGIIVLSPIFVVLIVLGTVFMRGNPFFTQLRPGKNEKIFKLIKFRTMDNRKDADGKLLPDEVRLNKYGRILRSTSLDELPELFNILRGDMAIVGPRPLLPRDVKYMDKIQLKRHIERPGLTGLAQSSGRNLLNWDEKLQLDVEYVENVSLVLDIEIIIRTAIKVIIKDGVCFEDGTDMDLKDWNELKAKERKATDES